jgi:hypothetical protein
MNSTNKVIKEVNWDLLFQPDQWYITPSVVQEHWQSLLISFLVVFISFIIFLVGQKIVNNHLSN